MNRSRRLAGATALVVSLTLAGCAFGPALPADAALQEDVPYLERDAETLRGDLFLPAGPGPHPAVLLLHGGGWRGGNPGQMAHIGRRLAAAGFVAYSAEYRLTPEHQHPAQLDDARAAFRWLARHGRVDPARMGVWGYSAGAHLALLLAFGAEAGSSEASNGDPRPTAAVGGGSPTDLRLFSPDSRLLVNLLGGSLDEAPEAWERASPITWVDASDPPVYLYHGRLDQVVDPEHAETLEERLEAAGVPVEYDAVRWGHFWVFLANRSVERRATAFLEQQLGGARAVGDAAQ